MKKLISLFVLFVFAIFLFTNCEEQVPTKGTLTLSITDAPIDMTDITGVYLTISEIQAHTNTSGKDWITFEEFEGPQTFNILELTDGESALLGSFVLAPVHYTQLRFFIDAEIEDSVMKKSSPISSGCYIEFSDGSTKPLFVPSASTSGWKAVGAFNVPINGDVAITADFDARKSVMERGANSYILKPTIRIIVDDQAGKITGGISNIPEGIDIIVYAYEDGVYTSEEAEDPVTDTTARFPNAITSDIVDEYDCYHLAFLAPMTYDLVITSSIEGEFQEVLGIIEDVLVESRVTTNQPIDLSSF